MSLMKTLAKIAIGVAVAKGVSSMTGKKHGSSGGGGLLDTLTGGGGQTTSRGGSLEDMLGSVLGGGSEAADRQSGGLGGMLDSLSNASTPRGGVNTASSSGGGMDSILEGLTGGGSSGGLGGLLGGLTGGGAGGGLGGLMGGLTKGGGGDLGGLLGGLMGGGAAAVTTKSFGNKFNDLLSGVDEEEEPPTAGQEMAAGLMLRAMIQAAKSDGKIDDVEREKLLGRLGDVSAEERAFVNAELASDIDIAGLAAQVPNGLEAQVYAMSVMGIDLDSRVEAQYLHDLATAMGLDKDGVNHIHAQLGVPSIYG